jgi:hypothetical protein
VLSLRRTLLAAAFAIAGLSPAVAQERLVIAGRDAAFGTALGAMVEAYQARNPGLRIERLELPGGALYERMALNARERTRHARSDDRQIKCRLLQSCPDGPASGRA